MYQVPGTVHVLYRYVWYDDLMMVCCLFISYAHFMIYSYVVCIQLIPSTWYTDLVQVQVAKYYYMQYNCKYAYRIVTVEQMTASPLRFRYLRIFCCRRHIKVAGATNTLSFFKNAYRNEKYF